MASLFISYAREDAAAARRLTEAFQGQDLDFWIDWGSIQPTEDWWLAIQKGIEESDTFLFLLSPASCVSRYCKQEVEHAVKNGKRLIPVVVRQVNAGDCPQELRHINWIFLRDVDPADDFAAEFHKLMTAIKTDYEWVKTQRQLQVKALEWDRSGREPSLLLRGKELRDAELQLATNSSKEPNPTDLQREYALRSRQASDDQRFRNATIAITAIIVLAVLAVVAVIQSSVARTAQATAEINAAAAQTSEANAVANAALARTAQSIAQENERRAEDLADQAFVRQLQAQALLLAHRRLDAALLLSLEAARIYPSGKEEAKRNLLNVLETDPRLKYYKHAHPADVLAVAIRPDGAEFATGSQDGTVLVWNSATAQPVGDSFIGASEILAFSPDLHLVAAGHDNGSIDIRDVNTGKLIHSLQHNQKSIQSLAFSPDGHVLVSGSEDTTISIWNVDTGEPFFFSLLGHTALVKSLEISPDGQTLAAGDDSGRIILWDLSTGEILNDTMREHTTWVTALAFSPDGKTLASGSGDHTIILWDLQDFQPRAQLFRHTSWVISLAFSPDGKTLVSGSQDTTMILWDVRTQQPIDQPLQGHRGGVLAVTISPDNTTLISGGRDHAVIAWKMDGFSRTGQVLSQNTTRIFGVTFSPDGKLLAAGDLDGSIALWDLDRKKQIEPLLIGHTGRVLTLAFSPDGKLLASAGDDGNVILWDLSSHKERVRLQYHTRPVFSVAFSADGKLLASGGHDPDILIWSLATFQPIRKLETGYIYSVKSVAFSPDGRTLASGGWDNRIWLWDWETGSARRLDQGDLGLVSSVAFRPDGRQLVSGGFPADVYLWDLQNDPAQTALSGDLGGHQSRVNRVVYSPNQAYLASGAEDGLVILWDLANHQPFAQFFLSRNPVNSVAFSPDGRTLAAGSCDQAGSDHRCTTGKIVIWDLDAGMWKDQACRIVGRNLSQLEWKTYLRGELYQKTCPQWPAGD